MLCILVRTFFFLSGHPWWTAFSRVSEYYLRILKATPPADSAKSPMYTKSQIAYSIYDGRYWWCQSSGPIPDDRTRYTTGYMWAASAIYTSEDNRLVELTPLLCNIFGQMNQNKDKTNPDGIAELVTNSERILVKGDKKWIQRWFGAIDALWLVCRPLLARVSSHQLLYSFLIVHSFLSLKSFDFPPTVPHF